MPTSTPYVSSLLQTGEKENINDRIDWVRSSPMITRLLQDGLRGQIQIYPGGYGGLNNISIEKPQNKEEDKLCLCSQHLWS